MTILNHNFIVIGGLCAHEDDRKHKRSEIDSVQLFEKGKNSFLNISFFNQYGRYGVSSMTWSTESPFIIYFSNGDDLRLLNLKTKNLITFEIPHLKDVHEISYVNNTIWIANTGFNEIVVFDPYKRKVCKRIRLTDLIKKCNDEDLRSLNNPDNIVVEVDKFHVNAAFKCYENKSYALVHHYQGRQHKIIDRIRNRVLKKQGNGGVIELESGQAVNLSLKCPHTVRLINGEYWIFSSTDAKLNIYNKNWELCKKIDTRGFGRGGDLTDDGKYFICGISAPRERYKHRIPKEQHVPNMVEIFDVKTLKKCREILINNIEQINNIYSVTDAQAALFKSM